MVGSKTITIDVVYKDGKEDSYHVTTEAQYLKGAADAIPELTLAGTVTAEYGLMITTVNGVRADYTQDGAYWAPVSYTHLRETLSSSTGFPPVSVHGIEAWKGETTSYTHYVGIMYAGKHDDGTEDIIYLAVNTYWEPLTITLPHLPEGFFWNLLADTGRGSGSIPETVDGWDRCV